MPPGRLGAMKLARSVWQDLDLRQAGVESDRCLPSVLRGEMLQHLRLRCAP